MKKQITMKHRHIYLWISFILTPFSGFAIDMYVPSLPEIQRFMATTTSMVQISMSTYLIGVALSLTFIGALSDSIGRKKIMLISSLLYTIASFSIAHSSSIFTFWLWRLLQGICVSGITVPSRAILTDVFDGPNLKKYLSYATIIWCLGPIVAPWIGGYFQHHFGWQSNFYFLTGYGLLAFVLSACVYQETIKQTTTFKIALVFKHYKSILKNAEFKLCSLQCAIIYSLVIIFSSMAPFLMEQQLGYSAIDYGHIALTLGLFWLLGNIFFRLSLKISLTIRPYITLTIALTSSLIMLTLSLLHIITWWSIVLPACCVVMIGGSLFPAYYSRCIVLFTPQAGSANALVFTFNMLGTAVSSGIASALHTSSPTPLASLYTIYILIGIFLSYSIKREAKNRTY